MTRFLKNLNIIYEKLVLFVLVIILLISAWCVYDCWYFFEHTADKNLFKYRPGNPVNAVMVGDEQISDDMVAWITIDDTEIDYPIMQAADNTKYLNADPFGRYSLAGSIFLDSRNTSDFSDQYSLVYGHHMEYGRMFGALDNFLDSDFLSKHSHGILMIGKNADIIYQLTAFASFRASAKDDAVFEPGKGDIREFIYQKTHINVDENKKILCLSTCAEGDAVSRIVVFCYINNE